MVRFVDICEEVYIRNPHQPFMGLSDRERNHLIGSYMLQLDKLALTDFFDNLGTSFSRTVAECLSHDGADFRALNVSSEACDAARNMYLPVVSELYDNYLDTFSCIVLKDHD